MGHLFYWSGNSTRFEAKHANCCGRAEKLEGGSNTNAYNLDLCFRLVFEAHCYWRLATVTYRTGFGEPRPVGGVLQPESYLFLYAHIVHSTIGSVNYDPIVDWQHINTVLELQSGYHNHAANTVTTPDVPPTQNWSPQPSSFHAMQLMTFFLAFSLPSLPTTLFRAS